MRVNLSAVQLNSIFKNAHITGQNNVKQKGIAQQPKQDKVSISINGKNSNKIEGLQKQKQAIMQRKSEIRAKAMEEGKSAQEINSLLECYDMEIKNIDAQIARVQAEETEEATTPKQYHKNALKTKQEAEKQKMADLTKLSVNAEQVDTIYSVKKNIDGDAKVLESEIQLDKSRNAGSDLIENKEDKLIKLQTQSEKLMRDIGKKLEETQENKYDDSNINVEEEKEQQQRMQKQQ